MEITNQTAVITGASGKLGSAIAIAVAEQGCNCVCHYHRNKTRADQIVEEIKSQGGEALAVRADLTNESEIAALFQAAKKFGIPKILVNSAAIFKRTKVSEVNFENARQTLDTNLIAPILTGKMFAESLKNIEPPDNKPIAKIINLADIGGIRPWANYTMYCASKAGLIAATKSMAKELAPNITVNAIAPGVVIWPEDGDREEYNRQVSMIPMQRTGKPEEIAAAVIFLLKNDYITGQTINVDGGRCI